MMAALAALSFACYGLFVDAGYYVGWICDRLVYAPVCVCAMIVSV
jgi:hypothetical protein